MKPKATRVLLDIVLVDHRIDFEQDLVPLTPLVNVLQLLQVVPLTSANEHVGRLLKRITGDGQYVQELSELLAGLQGFLK